MANKVKNMLLANKVVEALLAKLTEINGRDIYYDLPFVGMGPGKEEDVQEYLQEMLKPMLREAVLDTILNYR